MHGRFAAHSVHISFWVHGQLFLFAHVRAADHNTEAKIARNEGDSPVSEVLDGAITAAAPRPLGARRLLRGATKTRPGPKGARAVAGAMHSSVK